MATGALGVKAWYAASGAASMGEHVAASSGTISTAASDANVGDFVITASVDTTAVTLDMTDDDGNCWVWNNGALTPATPANAKMKTYAVTAVVSYSGTETLTASQCQDLWQGALGTKDILITASTEQGRFKFGSSGSDYSHAAADMSRRVLNATAADWVFNQTHNTLANHATASVDLGTFYVSVDGNQATNDEEHADTSLSGTITFTPSVVNPLP